MEIITMTEYNNNVDKQSYTLEEATELREKLLAKRRDCMQNIKILKGLNFKAESLHDIVRQYEIRQFENQVKFIDDKIRYLADHVSQNKIIEISIEQNEMTTKDLYMLIRQLVNAYDSCENGDKFVLNNVSRKINSL